MNPSFRFALLGRNVSYSKSPDIFTAIAQIAGITINFELISVEPADFVPSVNRLRDSGCNGFALTIPYKEAILESLDSLDAIAAKTGSVNCVMLDNLKLRGYNTDFYGFFLGLEPAREHLKSGPALVLGTGGAARTVIQALCTLPSVTDITVAGRSIRKIEPLLSETDRRIEFCQYPQLSPLTKPGYSLIVNATPLGGWNAPDRLPLPESFPFSPELIYYDLNYNADNKMVRLAQERGAVAIDGSRMLVAQALKSFLIWTGHEIPLPPIFENVFGG